MAESPQRSLAALVGAVLPTAGGACCASLGVGLAGMGVLGGTAMAWVSRLATPVALIAIDVTLLGLRDPQASWRRWHALVAVTAVAHLAVAWVVLPVAGALLGPASGSTGGVLP